MLERQTSTVVIQPQFSFDCLPIQYARQWPQHPETIKVAVVVVISNQKYLSQLSCAFPSWDAHLLSSAIIPIVHIDMSVGTSNVLQELRLRITACAAAFSQHVCGITHNENVVVLILKEFMHPASINVEQSKEIHSKGDCAQTVEYGLFTKYYCFPMLQLDVLNAFDFFAKIDADITFTKTVDLVDVLWNEESYFMHTLQMESDYPPCALTLQQSTWTYTQAAACAFSPPDDFRPLRKVFYSNFVVGWLGLFQSPQMLQYAEFWWSWPGGWRFRWSDQQFWTTALFVGAVDSKHVTDMSVWRDDAFHHKSNALVQCLTNISSLPPWVILGLPGPLSLVAQA